MASKKAKVARPAKITKAKTTKSATSAAKRTKTALKISGVTTRQKGFAESAGKRKQAGRDAKSAIKKS